MVRMVRSVLSRCGEFRRIAAGCARGGTCACSPRPRARGVRPRAREWRRRRRAARPLPAARRRRAPHTGRSGARCGKRRRLPSRPGRAWSWKTAKPDFEAGDGQLLLAGEVVGDAGGAQADQFGHGREAHALEALTVKDGDGGGNDIGAAALEAVARAAVGAPVSSWVSPVMTPMASRATRNRLLDHTTANSAPRQSSETPVFAR